MRVRGLEGEQASPLYIAAIDGIVGGTGKTSPGQRWLKKQRQNRLIKELSQSKQSSGPKSRKPVEGRQKTDYLGEA